MRVSMGALKQTPETPVTPESLSALMERVRRNPRSKRAISRVFARFRRLAGSICAPANAVRPPFNRLAGSAGHSEPGNRALRDDAARALTPVGMRAAGAASHRLTRFALMVTPC